jgi:hypothetical protein
MVPPPCKKIVFGWEPSVAVELLATEYRKSVSALSLSTPSQTPPPWARADVSYATAQLLIEFPHTDPQMIVASVNSAAETLPATVGSVLLMRQAREILRQRL